MLRSTTGLALCLALSSAGGCTDFVGASETADAGGGSSEGASTTSNDPTTASDPTLETASASGSGSTGNATNGSTGNSGDSESSDPTLETTTTDDTTGGSDPTTTGGEPGSTSSDGSTSGDASSSSSGGASSSSSSSTGDDGDELLGLACVVDDDCDTGEGQVCCEADQCLDTCMVPCSDVEDCPFEDMGCEHGHCLFPCDNDDADCAEWPGYTCQHGGLYCENDPP